MEGQTTTSREPPSLSTIEQLLGSYNANYPVLSRLCDFLDIGAVIRLSRCSRSLQHLYKTVLNIKHDINKHLRRFVKDPMALRALLATHNGIMVGEFALEFFDGRVRTDTTLDIFIRGIWENGTPDNGYLEELLVRSEGYRFHRSRKDPVEERMELSSSFSDEHQMMHFSKGAKDGSPRTYIRVWPTRDPIRDVLQAYDNTALVNFISWNRAYCLFPCNTLVLHQTFPLGTQDRRVKPDDEEYFTSAWASRGWAFVPTLKVGEQRLTAERFVSDDISYTISLEAGEIFDPDHYGAVADAAEFKINWSPGDEDYGLDEDEASSYIINCKEYIRHPMLKQIYIAWGKHSHEPQSNFWHNFAIKRLNTLQRLKVESMDITPGRPGAREWEPVFEEDWRSIDFSKIEPTADRYISGWCREWKRELAAKKANVNSVPNSATAQLRPLR
ncbi:hypothetical protein MMC25_007971 [Agyrium rufum]|nr:hypothetical protein [Agyrium rufum]